MVTFLVAGWVAVHEYGFIFPSIISTFHASNIFVLSDILFEAQWLGSRTRPWQTIWLGSFLFPLDRNMRRNRISIFVDFDDVLDLLAAVCEAERRVRFIAVFQTGRKHREESGLAITSKTITEQQSQLAVSVIDNLFFLLESIDDPDESKEGLVDVASLFKLLATNSSILCSFRSCQINEIQFGRGQRHVTLVRRVHCDAENQVTPATNLIQVVCSACSILLCLTQQLEDLFGASNLHSLKSINLEPSRLSFLILVLSHLQVRSSTGQ